MTDLIATITQYPEDTALLRGSPPKNLVHAFRIQVDVGEAIWLSSTVVQTSQLPDGAVHIDAPLAEGGLPSIQVTAGITSGEHNISGGTYKFLDDKEELGQWLAGKSANGKTLFNRYIEQYDFEEGEEIKTDEELSRALRYTFQIRDTIRLDRKVYEIKCEDINRYLDVDIFVERSWQLEQSITDSADDAFTTTLDPDEENVLTTYDYAWQHGPTGSYHVHPDLICGIALIQDGDNYEYFSYSGLESGVYTATDRDIVSFKMIARGLFGSTIQAWEVDADTARENRPKITAVPYAEEDPLSLALAIMTGKTMDGRDFPWNAGIDERWVNFASFANGSSDRRRTLRGHDKIKAKEYLEKEILSTMPAVMTPSPDGSLAYKAIPYDQTTAEIKGIVSPETVYGRNLGVLEHDAQDVASLLQLQWDKHPITGKYGQVTQWIDEDAVAETQASDPKVIESSNITTGRSTESEVKALGGLLYSRHARPVKRITAMPDRSLWHLEVCDTVLVTHNVKDYALNDGSYNNIAIPMMIGAVTHNQKDQTYSWQLIGYRSVSTSITTGGAELPDSEYFQGALPLPNVIGSIATGSPNITLGQKYYHLGDLDLAYDNPTFFGKGDFILWNKGVVSWSGQIDLTGRGGSGGNGSLSGAGAKGDDGYVQSPLPTGSVSVTVTRFENSSGDPQGVTRRSITSRPASLYAATSSSIPTTPTVENGRIVNAPSTLSGAGGNGGDSSSYRGRTEDGDIVASDAQNIKGSDGGNGGSGVRLVCDAGSSFVGSGILTISGSDSEAPTQALDVYGASGGGGGHGFFSIYHPQAGTPFTLDGARLRAYNGQSILVGDAASDVSISDRGAAMTVKRSHYSVLNDTSNNWDTAFSVTYLPASQTAVDTIYTSVLAGFFSTQPDGSVRLYVNDFDTSDANIGDARITEAELDTNNSSPAFRVYDPSHENAETNGWRDFDRDNDDWLYVYDALIAGKRNYDANEIISSTSRPVGEPDGTIWFNPTNNNQWILYESAADILIASNQVPQGEDMIQDISFARTYAGESLWRFTLNDSLSPVLTNNPAAPLSIDNQSNVAWARFTETGGESGSAGYQIDASGLSQYNRMIFRDLIPNSGSPSMRVKLRLASSLAANNPEFEGVAVRFRGFKLTGSAPAQSFTQVWDSDPSSKGERAWYSLNTGTFADAVFIEPVPTDLGIDYFTFELVVRAGSGQITLSNIECRNHYAVTYDLDVMGFQGWTSGINPETVVVGISGDDVKRYLRYILTKSVNISTGQLVQLIVKGAIKGRAFESQSGSNAQRLASNVGIMVKLRRRLTPSVYDYYTVSSDPVSVDNKTVYANSSEQFRARYDYGQAELLPFVEPTTLTSGYDTIGVDVLSINDIELDMIVADYVSASQGIE